MADFLRFGHRPAASGDAERQADMKRDVLTSLLVHGPSIPRRGSRTPADRKQAGRGTSGTLSPPSTYHHSIGIEHKNGTAAVFAGSSRFTPSSNLPESAAIRTTPYLCTTSRAVVCVPDLRLPCTGPFPLSSSYRSRAEPS